MKRVTLSELLEEGVSHDPGIKKRVMLRNGELPHITTFAQATFAPGQTVTPHAHADMAEVFFVETGEGLIWIEGEAYTLAAGVCVTVEAGETHELKNSGDSPLVLTYFGVKI
ncbi:MAG: cupin domain-containing protein [Anaerolineae bacterium]|nr:cupin domain-containing protein [Anaerolineae bacterium]